MSEPREFCLFTTEKNPEVHSVVFDYQEDIGGLRVIEHTAYLAEKARADKAERMLKVAVKQRNELVMEYLAKATLIDAATQGQVIQLMDAELEGV
jgi:hypothetical protein